MPTWARIAAVIAIVFGVVGLIAGAWMFAPLIVLGLAVLIGIRAKRGVSDRRP